MGVPFGPCVDMKSCVDTLMICIFWREKAIYMMQHVPWPEIYERELVPAIFRPWSFTTVASVEPEAGEHVLDVACGTGVVTRRVARYVGPQGRVVGLDLNEDMLAFARSLEPTNAIIEWVQGNALLLPFAEAQFDIVLCQGGLQFIKDRVTALREMHRVLKPGARLAVQLFNDLQAVSAFAVLARTIEAYVDPLVVEHIMAPFSLGDRNEAQALLRKAGFQKIALSEEMKLAHFHSAEHFVHSRLVGSSIRNNMSEEILERAIREGSAALRCYDVSGELMFPMVGYILLAHKD